MSNPYQPFFDKLDRTIDALEGLELASASDKDSVTDAIDLLRRSGFVLANLLNINAQVLPSLILPIEGEAEEADSPPTAAT
jgi:hypothetical protein